MSFPNIDYAFSGYDVVKGYPLATARDPGFMRAIFKADYVNGKSNGDCRYLLPKGIMAVPDVSCDVSFKSDIIKSKADFHKSLSASANIKGGGFGFEFSASASYQKSTSDMSSGEYVYIISKAQCTSYFSRIDFENPPPFDDGFLAAARALTADGSNSQDVLNFIDTYGTHFVDEVTFGSSYTQKHKMSSTTFSERSNEKFSVEVQAGYSGAFSVGGGFSLDSEQQRAASNFAKSVETTTVTVGSAPPSNGDAMTWASVSKENPVPIKYSLRPIADLFTAKFHTNSGINLSAIRRKLRNAPQKSCQALKSQGEPVSCEDSENWRTSEVVDISGGYPWIDSLTAFLYSFTLGTQRDCELMCNFNKTCIGYITLSDNLCSLVPDGAQNAQWREPRTGSQSFKLYLNKIHKDLVLKTKVPKLTHIPAPDQDPIYLYAYYSLSNARLPKAVNLKQCRNNCVLDPLCRAFRFGACNRGTLCESSDRTCFIYHQITNLPTETKANTEFHFIPK